MDLGMGIVVDHEELCFGERGSRASRSQLQHNLALTGLGCDQCLNFRFCTQVRRIRIT